MWLIKRFTETSLFPSESPQGVQGCGNSAVLSEDRITHPRTTALATGQMQRKAIDFFLLE